MIPLTIFKAPCSAFLILFGASLFLVVNVASQEMQTVNILLVHQEDDPVKLFNATLSYVESNPSLKVKIGKVHRYYSNGSDSMKLVDSFCSFVDKIMATDEKPDIAIDFTRIGVPSEAVKTVFKTVQMPTISATFGQEGDVREWRQLDPKQQKYLIQVSPPADILVQSVRSIVDKQNMTSAVLLFDQSYEMYHKYKSLLQNMPTRHLLTKILTGDKLTDQIVKLVHVDIVNFFIAATIGEITDVLTKASTRNAKDDGPYFSDEFAWYSMSLTPGKPQCARCQIPVSVVHLSPEPLKSAGGNRKSSLEAILEKSDLSLTDMFYFDLSLDAILAAADMKAQGKWTHDISNNTCMSFKLANPYPFLDLDLFEAFKKAGSENIMGEFNLEKNGMNFPKFKMTVSRLQFQPNNPTPSSDEDVGIWNAGFGGAQLLEYKGDKDLVKHLAMTVFRVVTVVQPPFVYRLPDCNPAASKYTNCFKGYCIELMNKIKDDLKFNYTIREVDGYGYMNKTFPHEWDGMVKELKDRRADIALGAMSVMAERESVVDFTVPYYDLVGISILMKKPKTVTSLFKFLTVLENDVWLCILGAYFFTSFLMWIFDRWSPYSYQNNREKYEDDEEKREFNLKECLWFCMTSLTPQGGGEAPKNLSGRLVAATWWLFGFIIIASYTANLAAFLTVSRLDAPIESLEDLSKQYKIQYAPMKGSSADIYFDRMAHIEHRFYEIWKDMSLNDSMSDFERSQLAVWDYPVSDKFTKMWQAMQENEPPTDFEDAVDRVRGKGKNRKKNDQFAFLGDATDIRYQVLVNCDLQMVGEEFSRKPYALAVQQGSPLKDQINNAILKLLNQRYLEQLKENWWSENELAVVCPKDDSQSDGISIHNIGGVFIVIFVGIIMACFTLIFEYWWYRKRNVSSEIADMQLPPPKEFGSNFSPTTVDKTNFNTQYNKQAGRTDLPSIENSW